MKLHLQGSRTLFSSCTQTASKGKAVVIGTAVVQGPGAVKKLQPKLGGRKKRAAKKAKKEVCTLLDLRV